MRCEELKNRTKNLDLAANKIYIGVPSYEEGSISCFKDGEEWVLLIIDDRQREHVRRGTEEEIVGKMYGEILLTI